MPIDRGDHPGEERFSKTFRVCSRFGAVQSGRRKKFNFCPVSTFWLTWNWAFMFRKVGSEAIIYTTSCHRERPRGDPLLARMRIASRARNDAGRSVIASGRVAIPSSPR